MRHQIEIGGEVTTDQLVQRLRKERFFKVDDRITQANFPLSLGNKIERVEMEVIHPRTYELEEDDGLRFLRCNNLQRPTIEQALRFVEYQAFEWFKLKTEFLMFLHEPWLDPASGEPLILYASYLFGNSLSLGDPRRGFNSRCGFAGFRPSV